MELRTSRLVLRPITSTDHDIMVRVNTDPELMRHLHAGVPHRREECAADLDRALATWREHGYGAFVTELHDGTVVGNVGFGQPAWCPEAMPGPDVGWTILQAHQRRGYATEAARAAIDWLFAAELAARVVGIHNTDNPPSGAVMQRLGLRWLRQTVHPECGYTIELWETTAAEWRNRGTA